MAKVILHIPEQEFVIDDDVNFDEAVELAEAGDLDYEYDTQVSNIGSEIVTEFIIEETD